MRSCVLYGKTLRSPQDVHAALAASLGFPAHYGRNLDALWDVLTRDLPGPVEIEWRNAATSRRRFGTEFAAMERVLRDAAAARPDLTVRID